MSSEISTPAQGLPKSQREFLSAILDGVSFDDAIKRCKVPVNEALLILADASVAAVLHEAQQALLRVAAMDAIRHMRALVRKPPKTEADKRLRFEAAKTILDRAEHAAGQAHRALESGRQQAAEPSLEDLERQLEQAKRERSNAAQIVDVPPDNAQGSAQPPGQDTDIFD